MSQSDIKTKTYEVTIEPSEKVIQVKEGQTVLDAAIRNGIQIPYGCRQGNCAACKAKVLDGDYNLMKRVSEYSLMSFEREEGYVLLCSTLVESDLVVELEEEESFLPFFPVSDFKMEVVENLQVTRDIHIIRLNLLEPAKIEYGPGQFFEIDVPGIDDTRAYSMASPCQEKGLIEFHVKRVKDGTGSNYMCDLKAGDQVAGSAPYGQMQLRDRNKDLLFIAGGSGMGPIKALIEELFSQAYEHQAWFFYGARTKEDLYLTNEWLFFSEKHSNFHFIPALSDGNSDDKWDGEQGYIAEVAGRRIENMGNMDAYLCGPPIMIETCLKMLYQEGLRGSNIFYDEF